MSRRDPIQTVWDRLEALDRQPRGPRHKFLALCPAHDDRTPSLSVAEGADGRALMHCFAGCTSDDVRRALELDWRDLFPLGHQHGPPLRGMAPPRPTVNIVLDSIAEAGIAYKATGSGTLWACDRCPACETGSMWVATIDTGVRLTCFAGCDQDKILARLARVTP